MVHRSALNNTAQDMIPYPSLKLLDGTSGMSEFPPDLSDVRTYEHEQTVSTSKNATEIAMPICSRKFARVTELPAARAYHIWLLCIVSWSRPLDMLKNVIRQSKKKRSSPC
jgi:hypothetical protein